MHVILSEEHDLDHIPGRVIDLHCPTALIVDLFNFSQLSPFFCLCIQIQLFPILSQKYSFCMLFSTTELQQLPLSTEKKLHSTLTSIFAYI